MTNKGDTIFSLRGETLKNIGIALGIATTLWGVITFATGRISQYDGYAARLAKLEASEQQLIQLKDENKQQQFRLDQHGNDLSAITRRHETLAGDVVQIRLSVERVRTLLERKP